MHDVDLAIVGSGFGGSLLALIARRLGLRVALIERGRHPRFAIGESASPLAGVVLEQLADRYDLLRIRPLSSYGSWRRAYPDVCCGLKRGFTYFKHQPGRRFQPTPDRAHELLVAASPADEVSDTHWFRADVDHFFVREAEAAGVDYVDRCTLDPVAWDASGSPVLSGIRLGRRVQRRARLLVDASGPRGYISRSLGLAEPGFDGYPGVQAFYSHFTGVARCADLPEYAMADRLAAGERPPYSIDDAALHHVFDEGWMWVLRFDNGITSAGVAVTDAMAAELRLADGEPAWRRLLARYPSIAEQFAGAAPVRAFTWMPRVPFRSAAAAGERWAMLPSAAAFVDPLFSSGIPMTLVGVERLAALLAEGADQRERGLREYARATLAEADHTARFVAGCYATFPRFHDFVAYSMFYFAAASYSETLRRLGRMPPGFLCAADAEFSDAVATLSPARGPRGDLAPLVAAAVARINVAGLCDAGKRNWYDADIEDAVRAAEKLGAPAADVRAALEAALRVSIS